MKLIKFLPLLLLVTVMATGCDENPPDGYHYDGHGRLQKDVWDDVYGGATPEHFVGPLILGSLLLIYYKRSSKSRHFNHFKTHI